MLWLRSNVEEMPKQKFEKDVVESRGRNGIFRNNLVQFQSWDGLGEEVVSASGQSNVYRLHCRMSFLENVKVN